jgi:hypothetical protein
MQTPSRPLPIALAAFLALALLFLTTATSPAAPADEIRRAVLASGAATVETASPAQFTKAFSAVLTKVKEANRPQYLSAAIALRPDLAPQITAAAVRAHGSSSGGSGGAGDCSWVGPLIQAAIAAAPGAKDAIIAAASGAAPGAGPCILAAAGESGNQTAFLRPHGIDAGNINSTSLGSINPANFSGQANIQSPAQAQITVCHDGTSLTLATAEAEAHIRNHPGDHIGACQ